MQSKLNCWLDRSSPFSVLAPLQVELLHEHPNVLQIYDMIPTSLSKEIIKSAQKTNLSRSQVHGKDGTMRKLVSASRTSSSTWIHESEEILSTLSRKVYPRLESLLSLDLKSRGALETFQVSSYNPCGHYNPHHDNILTTKVHLPGSRYCKTLFNFEGYFLKIFSRHLRKWTKMSWTKETA